MGERGMKDMTEMEMPLPDNTAAMMTGKGPFGSVGMGGMFSMVKVRKDQKPGDYSIPAGTSTRPVKWRTSGRESLPDTARFKAEVNAPKRFNARRAHARQASRSADTKPKSHAGMGHRCLTTDASTFSQPRKDDRPS